MKKWAWLVPLGVLVLLTAKQSVAQSPEPSSSKPSAQPAPLEVKVQGQRKARTDKSADSVRVGKERLRESSRPTLLETLAQEAPDMYVPSRGAGIHGLGAGASGGIHLRGLGGSPNSQVVVIEDGIPDYQGLFGHPIPDAYIPFLLDEAVIVRGGDSVLYGTGAMAGAILLRSRWRMHDGWEVENDGAMGSYGTIRESASVLGKAGRIAVAGSVFSMHSDGHRKGAGGDSLIGQLGGKVFLGQGWELVLRQKAMHLKGADPGPVSHPSDNHYYDVWRDRLSLEAHFHSENVELRAQPYFNLGRHELYDGFLSVDTTSGAIFESDIKLFPGVKLLVGSAIERVDGKAENRISRQSMPIRAQQSSSWYEQLTVEPFSGLQLVAGTREVASATYGSAFLYKIGARWSVGRGWYIRARQAKNFRQPTLSELYLPFPAANPNLKPEHSVSSDAGVGYASEKLEVSAGCYRTEVDNLIKYFGAYPTSEVVNIDHTEVSGVEGQLVLREIGPVGFRLGASWQDVGRYTRQNPSARGVFAVEYEAKAGGWTLKSALEGEWVHGLYMNNYRQDPMDDILVMNLGVRAQRRESERETLIEPYMQVRNLLDSRYAYVKDYTMPGLSGLLGLRVVL